MEYTYLNTIQSPADLKKIPREALSEVCNELRDFIIQELSHNPGHLASSLGTIELTVALHYVLDTPNDRIVWDVGHQAYGHKILTGRRERFHTNRQFGGLAPFPTPFESEYDAFISGHSSNSISAALGIDIASSISANENTDKRKVVAVIGDGAMTGGLAFEGLNNMSMNKNDVLIVLNDNNMAIEPLKGGITQYLVDLTTSTRYNKWRWKLYLLAKRLGLVNEGKKGRILRWSNSLKVLFSRQPQNIFQGLNIRYFGPVDGHDVDDLVRILSEIKNHRGPKVLHIITKKGKGYAPAELNQTIWHAPGEFNVNTGERLSGGAHEPLWQEVFGNELLALARKDKRIVGVTPAMLGGCSMNIMQREMPDRVFDVGIAEGHAVTFSAGLAKEGVVPFCNIYSSFLQRAYDNIIHDVALQRLHVVLCIDRAGIVGNDGATHHGLFDLAFLRPIPNLTVGAPMDADQLRVMMRYALAYDGAIAIRYPRGRAANAVVAHDPTNSITGARCIKEGSELAVLTIGAIGNTAMQAIGMVEKEMGESKIAHYDMRWLKPLDTQVLDEVGQRYSTVITIEDGVIQGGLGSAVAEYMSERGYKTTIIRLGVDNQFVEHGSTQELFHLLHLDKEGICESLLQALAK